MGSCEQLADCKLYVDQIINDVMSTLTYNAISYRVCNGGTELVVHGYDKGEDDLRDLIENSLNIPKIITSMLLDIHTGGSDIFIRLKYN